MAMFLVLVLLVGVVSLFIALLGSSAKANDQAVGVLYAERVLDRLSARGRPTYPAFDSTLTGTQGFYTHDEATQTSFFYSVTATELTPSENKVPDAPGETWLLETEVRWWNNVTTTKAGQGNLYVRQARVVYVSR